MPRVLVPLVSHSLNGLLTASMNRPPYEVGQSPHQPFSLGRRELKILSPLRLGEG